MNIFPVYEKNLTHADPNPADSSHSQNTSGPFGTLPSTQIRNHTPLALSSNLSFPQAPCPTFFLRLLSSLQKSSLTHPIRLLIPLPARTQKSKEIKRGFSPFPCLLSGSSDGILHEIHVFFFRSLAEIAHKQKTSLPSTLKNIGRSVFRKAGNASSRHRVGPRVSTYSDVEASLQVDTCSVCPHLRKRTLRGDCKEKISVPHTKSCWPDAPLLPNKVPILPEFNCSALNHKQETCHTLHTGTFALHGILYGMEASARTPTLLGAASPYKPDIATGPSPAPCKRSLFRVLLDERTLGCHMDKLGRKQKPSGGSSWKMLDL